MKWENKDWFWLLSIMAFVMGTSYMYKNEFMNLISYASTFLSISLAFIAIYISVREVTKADKIKDETLVTLIELKERISQLDTKVSSIDIDRIKMGIDDAVSNFKQGIEVINKSDGQSDASNGKIIEKLDDKIDQLSNELKSSITIENKINSNNVWRDMLIETNLTATYIKLSKTSENGLFTLPLIFEELNSKTPYYSSKKEVVTIVNRHLKQGTLKPGKEEGTLMLNNSLYSRQ
ncbi:hypothetical protein ACP8HI_13520 [Paenibacillus sp. FA6]|uniref:hypothetical protein n=1 Tax=Paenibacillus sp. FA6 TaxID=3413029 RepID=UPI003F65B2C3